ncbi:MAG TPA: hypothetical protein VFB66_27525 [Tepidisphaeraceae bacterium]|nr:hypothetical protein [Tepidisphaeraceae bacterium]
MRQVKSRKKNARPDRDEESSFKRLGGRNLGQDEDQDGGQQEDQEKGQAEDEGSGDEGPSMSERAEAGVKAASHLGKAASGGKLRMAYSLWRASKQIPVAAAGTGDLIKRHPAVAALLAGLTAAAATYVLASRAAANSEAKGKTDEGPQGSEGERAEDQADGEGNEDGGEGRETSRSARRSKSRR